MRLLVIGRPRSGTTITRKILSSHPEIWITNELLLYDFFCGHSRMKSFNDWVKRRFSRNYRQPRYAFPFEIDAPTFKKQYKKILDKDSSLTARIMAAEKCIFQEKYKIFGDKGGYRSAKTLKEIGLPFKAIYMYRDGRDSVASSMSRHKDKKDDTSWKTADAYQSSLHWASAIKEWFEIKKLLNTEDYIEIPFEQFMKTPDNVYQRIAEFLDVESIFDQSLFQPDHANMGRYKRDIPEWKTTFSREAIEVLEELKYI